MQSDNLKKQTTLQKGYFCMKSAIQPFVCHVPSVNMHSVCDVQKERGASGLLTLKPEAEELAPEVLRGTGEPGGLWEAHTRCIMWYSSCCGLTRVGTRARDERRKTFKRMHTIC